MPDTSNDRHFYRDLASFDDFDDVASSHFYQRVPDSWHIAITDIDGSTRAIEDGRYKQVNAIGVGSIVAATNAVEDLELPYVFGGDGATLLLPGAVRGDVRTALAGVAHLAEDTFDLDLRVGIVPVAEIRRRGGDITVAKYNLSDKISLAMLAGGGAELAEAIIKDDDKGERFRIGPDDVRAAGGAASLEGFHCRWNPIESRRGTIVSLLVVARTNEPGAQRDIYRAVLDKIRSFGDADDIRPVARDTLTMATNPGDFEIEAGMHIGRTDGIRSAAFRAKTAVTTRIGNRLMRNRRSFGGFDGDRYPDELVTHTDFRKFDDALRMVLDLTHAQLGELDDFLADEHASGRLAYGIHPSESALMTCLVLNLEGEHVHFIDGADGGYALAARQLKQQLKASA